MAKKINTTFCIIGIGTSGLSAALYAYRANIDVVVLDGPVAGGSLTLTTAVENYPGIASITGPALMNSIRAQVLKPGVQIIAETATSVDFSKPPFKVFTVSVTVKADAVIIACGAVSRSSPLTWSTTGPSAVTQTVEGIPTTAFLRGQVKLHSGGYIETKPGRTQTSVNGVFAAGDVQDTRYKQAVTAAGSGVMAAIDAQEYLAAKPALPSVLQSQEFK